MQQIVALERIEESPEGDAAIDPNERLLLSNVLALRDVTITFRTSLGELPVTRLAEEIETAGPGQVRAMITVAGNPVLSTPNGRQLEQALDGLEFMLSIDFYINETTRYADLILPPTAPLEHDHYDTTFNAFAVRNVTRFNEAVLAKPEGTLHDWEIFVGLAKAFGVQWAISIASGP